jgi:hypothetical protein
MFYTMKKYILLYVLIMTLVCHAEAHSVFDSQIRTLQVVVDDNWMEMPVMKLNSDEMLNVSFDQLSHTYHRYMYKIEHCEADWSRSEQLLESDYLVGMNDNTIDDYEESINTSVLYTHYALQIPNDRCKLKMSGNYILSVYDEDNNNRKVLEARFMVLESLMNVGLGVTSNTDIDVNKNHQQLSMTVKYNGLTVTNPTEQIKTNIIQNGINGESVANVKPDYIQSDGLQWTHNRQLIFNAGNEYHKFEVLSTEHPTMGIEHLSWDGNYYHAFPFVDEARKNYVYDEDADGAFYIRNSDNSENNVTCDYVWVNYQLKTDSNNIRQTALLNNDYTIEISGDWTNDSDRTQYVMHYDRTDNSFKACILQKLGYYSYRYMVMDDTGYYKPEALEPAFYQTENKYYALVYYRPMGGRTDRLVGYTQISTR